MSRLLEVQEQILQTNSAIVEIEDALLSNGGSFSLQATAASLLKRQRKLEDEFLEISNLRGVDVCSYRLLTTGPKASLETLTSSLAAFQKLFSVVYEAIKNGRRETSRLSAESISATSFDFGYTFAGSVGVVLTIPNERLILADTDLDHAIEMIFKMANCESSEEILEFAQGLGTAPIACMSTWANSHTDSAIGANITWHRGEDIRSSLQADLPVFERIRDIINATSDTEEEEFEVEGQLVGADIQSSRFHMILSDETDLKGKFENAISPSQTVELPKRYKAFLRKTTVTIFSTNKKNAAHFLLRLEPLDGE